MAMPVPVWVIWRLRRIVSSSVAATLVLAAFPSRLKFFIVIATLWEELALEGFEEALESRIEGRIVVRLKQFIISIHLHLVVVDVDVANVVVAVTTVDVATHVLQRRWLRARGAARLATPGRIAILPMRATTRVAGRVARVAPTSS